MIEMLMVAVILGVGLLGVAAQQLIAIRAVGGSTNLNTAAIVANRLLDQIEEEARLTWLNQTSTTTVQTGLEPPNLYYLANAVPFTLAAQPFDALGNPLPAGTANPPFSAVVSAVAVGTPGATMGTMMDVSVTVQFTDAVTATQTVTRSLCVSRRIVHA
jgi:type II secretory pathway pseudopilin PulG